MSRDSDKEHIAGLLRRGVSPSVVMGEVRLREVVNGSPGSIVQVRHDDLRELLLEYRRLALLADTPSVEPRWTPEHVEIEGGYCTGCGGGHIEPQIAPRDDPESPFYIHRDCYDDTGQPMRRERVDPEFTDPLGVVTSDGSLDVEPLDVETIRARLEALLAENPTLDGRLYNAGVRAALNLLPTQASDSPETT